MAWCNDGQIGHGGPHAGITGQDGAHLARFLLDVVHGTSRDAALLIALGIRDKVALRSMSPADFPVGGPGDRGCCPG
jgi:hypothetical protein